MASTPKGGLDEGVLNLERFIGILTSTIEQVQGHTSAIEQHASALESLDDKAESDLSDLGGALEDFETRLEAAEDEVEQEIGSLRDEAREGADEQLQQSGSDVDRAGGAYDAALDEGRGGLEESHAALGSEGFNPLESTLESVESALAGDRQEAEAGFDGLDAAAAELRQRATDAFAEAEAAFDRTVEEITDKRDALETDGGDAVTALDQAGDDIDAEARSLAGELETAYDLWHVQIEAETDDLVESVKTLMTDTAASVDAAAEAQLDTPAGTVLDNAFEPCLEELAELQSVVEGAQGPATDDLLPLVDELERSAIVIETIDRLLDQLES
jgi:chromosome segregation ATPase